MEYQKSLPFSTACVILPFTTILGAKLLGRFGPRRVVTAAGILAGLGMLIPSLSTSPWVHTLAFGILIACGIGFTYSSASPTSMKWFPESKTGLISGIVVAGFGWAAPGWLRSRGRPSGIWTAKHHALFRPGNDPGRGDLRAVHTFTAPRGSPPDWGPPDLKAVGRAPARGIPARGALQNLAVLSALARLRFRFRRRSDGDR